MRNKIYWLPLFSFSVFASVFLAAAIYVKQSDKALRDAKAQTVAQQVALSLEVFSQDRIRAIDNLLLTWPTFTPNATDWFNSKSLSVKSILPGLNDILWVEQRNQIIKWSTDPKRADQLIGAPLSQLSLQLNPNNENYATTIISSDGRFFLLFGRSISPQEPELGYVVGSFDLTESLSVMLGELIGPQFNFMIQDGETHLFSSGEFVEGAYPVVQPISFGNRFWLLSMQSVLTSTISPLMILTVGLGISLLVSLFLYFQLKQSRALSISQARFQSASKAALDAIIIYRFEQQDFFIADWNAYCAKLFTRDMAQFERHPLSRQLKMVASSLLFDKAQEVYNSEVPYETYILTETPLIKASWLKIQIVRTDDGIALTLRDVTLRINAQKALEKSERRYKGLVNGLHNHFVYRKSLNHHFEYVSEGVETILGYDANDFLLQQHDIITTFEGDAHFQRQLVITGNQPTPYTLSYRATSGDERFLEFTDTPFRGDMGQIEWIEGIARDVTQERALQAQVNFQANHDELTGLFNRYAFDNHLKSIINGENKASAKAVLCFIDMDRFKLVNDTCGHPAGDQLLKNVANLFATFCKKNDFLARVGGDEFCLVFSEIDLVTVKERLQQLLDEVSKFRFEYEGKAFYIGASIGVIEMNRDGASAADYVVAADNACYEAKRLGRNRYCIHNAQDASLQKVKSELELVGLIQSAMDNNTFEIYLQGIHPMAAQAAKSHFEALLRLPSPNDAHRFISPSEFIPIAEKNGLMDKIDLWVVKRVVSLLSANRSWHDKIDKCAINLSGVTLGDENSQLRILNFLKQTDIDLSKLCFEITETSAITNLNTAKKFIEELHAIDCSISLDDFGAGMSSFTYLKHLPVDYVKIDGSFVRNMHIDPIDFATVKAIHTIAQSMGKRSIAEFVGHPDIVGALKSLGIDYGQGFALSQPKPAYDVLSDSVEVTNYHH